MKQDSIINEVYTDFKTAIEAIAHNLGVAAEHVYEVLVMQQVVEAVYLSFITLLAISGMSITVYIITTAPLKDEKGRDVIPAKFVVSIIIGVVCLFLFIAMLFQVENIFTGFLNPEYGAMQEIKTWIRR